MYATICHNHHRKVNSEAFQTCCSEFNSCKVYSDLCENGILICTTHAHILTVHIHQWWLLCYSAASLMSPLRSSHPSSYHSLSHSSISRTVVNKCKFDLYKVIYVASHHKLLHDIGWWTSVNYLTICRCVKGTMLMVHTFNFCLKHQGVA